jgi:hypothetical protein
MVLKWDLYCKKGERKLFALSMLYEPFAGLGFCVLKLGFLLFLGQSHLIISRL